MVVGGEVESMGQSEIVVPESSVGRNRSNYDIWRGGVMQGFI